MTVAILNTAAASALRYRKRLYPSQWLAQNGCVTSQACGTEGPFDIWWWPLNVGIIDAALEGKRGSLVQKPVQMGVSHYMQGLACWEIETNGGPLAYSMAKDDTVREHVLDRIEPIFASAPGLLATALLGRDNHETILSKRFTNASIKFFGSGSVNNFISNPYRAFFADEFERMGVFPDGSDAVELAKGRQSAFGFPKLYGWSTPLDAETGITAHVEHESDCREFHIRCPHCREPITLDPERDVVFARHEQDGRPIADSVELRCYKCRHAITDSDRALAIVHAAQSACPWFTAVPFDDSLGWISTLPPDVAADREFAGFRNFSHLYNHRMPLREFASRVCSVRTEARKKVLYNDVYGKPYTITAQVIDAKTIAKRIAPETRRAYWIPTGALFVTLGSDVQGGGITGDLMFYFDVSAWVMGPRGPKKVTIEIDRIKGTYNPDPAAAFPEIKTFVRTWTGRDDAGGVHKIDTACFDAGYRTRDVYAICNELCRGSRAQWCLPVIYSTEKVGKCETRPDPQGADVGDASRKVLMTSRDYAVGRAMDRITTEDALELPMPLKPEIERHYLANIQIEDYDRNGNFRGLHWVKKQVAKGYKEDDDWLQAAALCELAAVQLGIDRQAGAVVATGKAAAQQYAERKEATSNRPADWIQRSKRVFRGRHGFQKI